MGLAMFRGNLNVIPDPSADFPPPYYNTFLNFIRSLVRALRPLFPFVLLSPVLRELGCALLLAVCCLPALACPPRALVPLLPCSCSCALALTLTLTRVGVHVHLRVGRRQLPGRGLERGQDLARLRWVGRIHSCSPHRRSLRTLSWLRSLTRSQASSLVLRAIAVLYFMCLTVIGQFFMMAICINAFQDGFGDAQASVLRSAFAE